MNFGDLKKAFFAFLVLCVTLLFLYLRRTFNYWKTRNIPYEKPTFFFGNLTFVMRKSFSDYFRQLRNKFPTSDCVGIFLGWKPALIVQTSELARKVLTKDFDYFDDRLCTAAYKGDPLGSLNLFTVKNPIWGQIRPHLSPMFTALRLKRVTDLMNDNARELVLKIKRDHIDKNEPVNLKVLFSMYASDTVGSSVFGIKVSALNDLSSPLWYITSNMVEWTFGRGLEFITIFFLPAVAALLRLKFFSPAASDYIKKLFWSVVNERKASGTEENYKDLVNHLTKLKNNLKLPAETSSELADDMMLAQVAVFILGSIETSSTTLSYALNELAHHPEHQERLYEEINEAMKQKGKDILDYDDLLELKFLSACILETLRLHPPVPYLDRVCNNTYQLTDAITISKGTPVFVNVMALHFNEEVFPEPDKWKPERMIDVQETDNIQFSFIPFGDGPRFCIGKRYGVMQIRAALAQILAHYRVEPDPNEPYHVKCDPYSLFLSPLGGGKVKFAAR